MKEVNPRETPRAAAFDLWMKAPMPMVTLFKTLDVSRLVKVSRRRGMKLNMLMCWCIGRAAAGMREFYLLPVGGKLMQYDRLAVCTIVADRMGGLTSCDVSFTDDLSAFNADYLRLTRQAAAEATDHNLLDHMVIGTSALVQTEIDGAIGIYSGIYNNPFLIWGKYRRWFRCTLPVSFQFHHTQMDGAHAAHFLERLQREIDGLAIRL